MTHSGPKPDDSVAKYQLHKPGGTRDKNHRRRASLFAKLLFLLNANVRSCSVIVILLRRHAANRVVLYRECILAFG